MVIFNSYVNLPEGNLMSPPTLEVYGIRGILDYLRCRRRIFALWTDLTTWKNWSRLIHDMASLHKTDIILCMLFDMVDQILPDSTSNIHQIEKTLGSFPTFSQK
jgi:hypothetical protein